MAIRILVAGDLHLGRTTGGIPGNPEESSTRYTWNRIVESCTGVKADILFLTGDIVDRDNRYFEAIGSLRSGFDKLKNAGVSVYMVAGNHDHDVLQQITRSGDHDNVHLLGMGGDWELVRYEKGGRIIQIAGWSFPTQYVHENPLVTCGTLSIDPGYPAIGLLHCDVAGGESKYGPVALNDFKGRHIDAWMLGHIHKPLVLSKEDPVVIYPGSPHAMSPKETGAHGAVLLTVTDKGPVKYDFVPLSPLRFEPLNVDITGTASQEDVRTGIIRAVNDDAEVRINDHEGLRWLVYDMVLDGEHKSPNGVFMWGEEGIRDLRFETEGGVNISIRKFDSSIMPLVDDLVKLAAVNSPAGKLAETILAIEDDRQTPFLDGLISDWKRKYQEMDGSVTYQPLRSVNKEAGGGDQMATGHILKECRKMLAELMRQSAT